MQKFKSILLLVLGRKESIGRLHYAIFLLLWILVLLLLVVIGLFLSALIVGVIYWGSNFGFYIQNFGWSMYVTAFILSLFIIKPYILGRITDIGVNNPRKNVWYILYNIILYIHIIFLVLLLAIGSAPAVAVISFWGFSAIPMIIIAFPKKRIESNI